MMKLAVIAALAGSASAFAPSTGGVLLFSLLQGFFLDRCVGHVDGQMNNERKLGWELAAASSLLHQAVFFIQIF
jgi:hypothetical protein